MKTPKILAIGNNCCDRYLESGMMYPGGECANTAVFAAMNGAEAAFLGMFGNDALAAYNRQNFLDFGVDITRCRYYEGENGWTKVRLENGDRVFAGANKGGPLRYHSFDFTEEEYRWMQGFDMVYSGLHGYLEAYLPELKKRGIPVAYDFSFRREPDYVDTVAPYIQVALFSCAGLTEGERESLMRRTAEQGVSLVIGTVGTNGSYALQDGRFYYQPAEPLPVTEGWDGPGPRDTNGAGDAYFAALLCALTAGEELPTAMRKGAVFSASVCQWEGVYGHGAPIPDERRA